MMKIDKSKCEILDIDNSVDIQIDDLEENLCRTYYQVNILFDQNVVDTLIYMKFMNRSALVLFECYVIVIPRYCYLLYFEIE